MAVPGIKVVAPSNAADAKGLLAAAIRDPDPVIVFEHKYLLSSKGDVPEGEHLVPLGEAAVVREGSDITVIALAAMVPKALAAAEMLAAEHGISTTVIDLRTLVPLDAQTLLRESARTGRIFTVEENPRLCGWGAEIVSIIQEQAFSALKQPITRITTPHVPIPATDQLEDAVLPSVERIVSEILRAMQARRAC
jgi:pyruvate dehydrogenase E1 component beta subunit